MGASQQALLSVYGGEQDPFFANVTLLMHCDGANNSTTFVDSSPANKTLTASGNAKITTARSKFGSGSADFDATSNTRISTPTASDFDFSGDFTLEAFVHLENAASGPEVFVVDGATSAHVGHGMGVSAATKISARLASNATPTVSAVSLIGTTTLVNGQWYHIAFTRSGTSHKLFLDGVEEASQTTATAIRPPDGRSFIIGQYYDNTERLDGQMDEIRFTKGIARYTANFTPPTAPFPS